MFFLEGANAGAAHMTLTATFFSELEGFTALPVGTPKTSDSFSTGASPTPEECGVVSFSSALIHSFTF